MTDEEFHASITYEEYYSLKTGYGFNEEGREKLLHIPGIEHIRQSDVEYKSLESANTLFIVGNNLSFPNLVSVDSLHIQGQNIKMPSLIRAGALTISPGSFENEYQNLEEIERVLCIHSHSIKFPKLKNVGGAMTISGLAHSIKMPMLNNIGMGIFVSAPVQVWQIQ